MATTRPPPQIPKPRANNHLPSHEQRDQHELGELTVKLHSSFFPLLLNSPIDFVRSTGLPSDMRRLPALRSCQAITQRTPHWIQGCHRTKPRTYTVGLKRHDIADYLPPAQSPTTLPRSTNRFVTRIAGAIRPVEVEMEQPKKRTVSETRVRGPEQPVLTRVLSMRKRQQMIPNI